MLWCTRLVFLYWPHCENGGIGRRYSLMNVNDVTTIQVRILLSQRFFYLYGTSAVSTVDSFKTIVMKNTKGAFLETALVLVCVIAWYVLCIKLYNYFR